MKSILIFSFLFFLASFASAQSNFKEGYIITNENDTIKGFVDFRTSGINVKLCKFKEQELGEVKTYYPGDISGYRFTNEGKFYISSNIEIEGQKKEVFLEYLLKGILSLYYYIDDREYYFIQDEQGKIFVIDKKDDEYVYNETLRSNVVKKDNKYIGMLKSIFKESQSTTYKVNKIRYNQDDIINVTKDYHDNVCTSGDKCIIFETKKDKQFTVKKITLYAGIQYYTFNLNVLGNFPAINNAFPVIGGQLNLLAPRLAKSVSFQVDVALSGINGNTAYDEKIYDGRIYHKIYDYKTLLSSNKIGVKYTHFNNKFCPTFEFGLSTILMFASSSTYSVANKYNPTYYEPEVSKDLLPDKALLGLYGAIGVDYVLANGKVFALRIGYEWHESFYSIFSQDRGSQIKAFSLKLGYTL